MEGKKITLKDISVRTGFTINTISRALKDKEDISAATRNKIQRLAKEMGYIGNSIAGSLRSGFTRTIAVVVGDISNPHFGIMVKEIERVARKYNYTIFVISTEEDDDLEERAIYSAISKNVDGIIICPAQKSMKNIRFLQKNGIPFVLLGRRFEEEPEYDYVICDDFTGGYQATKHLLDTGHRNILFLNGPSHISSAKERFEGYKFALEEAGFAIQTELVKENGIMPGDSRQTVKNMIDKGISFTGVFAFNDVIAWETIYMLNKMGFNVPKDYSVVGFDNIQARIFSPFPLTSVSNSKSKMSRRALDILLHKINAPEDNGKYHEVIETRLIIRESTRG
jgi:LacI family transcriptional regulator